MQKDSHHQLEGWNNVGNWRNSEALCLPL